MNKILITAFEPFGLIGEWVRRNNASAQVMDKIKQECGDEFLYESLQASQHGISKFSETLKTERPSGIISLGEHLLIVPNKVKLEPYAHDMPVSALPLTHLFSDKVKSDFIAQIDNQRGESQIGGYYCNQIYLQGMGWAKENGDIPVAFIHVPVLGNHAKHTDQIVEVLQEMQNYASKEQGIRDQTHRKSARISLD